MTLLASYVILDILIECGRWKATNQTSPWFTTNSGISHKGVHLPHSHLLMGLGPWPAPDLDDLGAAQLLLSFCQEFWNQSHLTDE